MIMDIDAELNARTGRSEAGRGANPGPPIRF